MITGKAQPVRLGRGSAPLEFTLPFTLPSPLLAVGGQMKNTIALAWDHRVVISPHIGDLGSPRSQQVFEQTIADLTRLYGITLEQVVCDAHPDYSASRWAERSGLKVRKVFHHHAHASALAAEHKISEPMLVFTWDGTGYGEDGTLWGGEGLFGAPGHWQRVSSFRPFRLPGGEKAGREPWRSALALCWELGKDWHECPAETGLIKQAWQKQINSPLSSSVGRLFDAAAALTGIVQYGDFEGHAPMWLEAASREPDSVRTGVAAFIPLSPWERPALSSVEGAGERDFKKAQIEPARTVTESAIDLPFTRNAEGLWLIDWGHLLSMLQNKCLSLKARSNCFHASLALALVKQAKQIRAEHDFIAVGLTGGVFQNRLLTEYATALLRAEDFSVYLPEHIPGNDAGISFGQIIEAGSKDLKDRHQSNTAVYWTKIP